GNSAPAPRWRRPPAQTPSRATPRRTSDPARRGPARPQEPGERDPRGPRPRETDDCTRQNPAYRPANGKPRLGGAFPCIRCGAPSGLLHAESVALVSFQEGAGRRLQLPAVRKVSVRELEELGEQARRPLAGDA